MIFLKKKWVWVMCLVFIINISGFIVVVNRSVEWIEVVVAKKTLDHRQLIQEGDVELMKIPKIWLNADMFRSITEVTSYRVAKMTQIPQGSILYSSQIESSDRSELTLYQVYDDQVAVPLSVDLSLSLGNTLVVGQYVDLLLVLSTRNQPASVDWIFKDVRILAIKDRNGLDMTAEKAQKIPAIVLFAINQKDAQDYYRSIKGGQIRLVAHGLDRFVSEEALRNDACTCWSRLHE